MKVGRGIVFALAVLLLALAGQGCKYTLIGKEEMSRLRGLDEINKTQAGFLSEVQHQNAELNKDVKRQRDAYAQLSNENQKNVDTINAQRKVMDGLQRVIDQFKGMEAMLRETGRGVSGLGPDITVSQGPGGVTLEMQGDVLFDSGKHTLKSGGKALLDRLVPKLKDYPREIRISGYTDSDPILHTAGQYEDNMVLSAMRAWSVWKYLVEQGVSPNKMSIMGHGEYALIHNADGAENKAASRRAEILLVVPQPEVQLPKE
ncbi:MAG: OmpA/MotB family protein [Alphaproteobacteria bacterium]